MKPSKVMERKTAPTSPLHPSPEDWTRLAAFAHAEPHRVLGAHPALQNGRSGVVIRAFHPDAQRAECLLEEGETVDLEPIAEGGLFAAFLQGRSLPVMYRLRFSFADGSTWERGDPYRFMPTLGDVDLHLFNEGNHRRLWDRLGAHVREMEGVRGVAFAVWAPNAQRVSVTGDFCGWDGRLFPMRHMGASGVFELFIPDLEPGTLYKYEIKTQDGALRLKSDPYAQSFEPPPNNASRVYESDYTWSDQEWMQSLPARDYIREPASIYEVHLGSWMRADDRGHPFLNYRELAPRLCEHVKRFGFTHLELMPVAEHPLPASWGYQVTGYYAPTWRYGDPDDFRHFVDVCHQHGIGVILDWVPAHFPRDDFALRRFDGTALYEHEDPRQGEHPDWGTLIFNYGRAEVCNFLVANALYWLKEFHVDGLRVDAVASMLYLDYSREAGQWLPNRYGGRENIEAIEFLRAFNEAVRTECPGHFTVAEESTAWGGVTRPASEGGLGFTFKWNMGWMHDTLAYFSKDPIHRRFHQNELTFAMLYEYTEHFINALSHDEVVHGKRTMLEKMPGDIWQKFANLRTLLAYQFTRPGKVLLFMGVELAPWNEWNYDTSLEWHLADDPMRQGLQQFMTDLGKLYHAAPCLWASDPDPSGFGWISCNDYENGVVVYRRDARHAGEQPLESTMIVALNLTPVPRENYCVGTPRPGRWVCRLSSDHPAYGGSGYPVPGEVWTEDTPLHGLDCSVRLTLPPLSAIIYESA